MKLIKTDFEHGGAIAEQFWHDEHTGKVVVNRLQDVEPHLDLAKEMFNQHNRAEYGDSNGNHLVARIPLIVVEQWKEKGFDWFKATDNERRLWLDREENAVFKVRPGKLGGKPGNRITYKAR